MTDNSHAITQVTVDTTVMFPRYKPNDLLFVKRFFSPEYPFFHNADIVVATSDGRITIGRLCKHDANGVILSQLSHAKPVFIAQQRDPILYRITGFAPYIPSQRQETRHSAA